MTPERLLRWLRDAGFRVRADEGDVVVAPGRPLTEELRRRIRLRKPQLLEALGSGVQLDGDPPCLDCGRPLPLSGVRCPDCRDATGDPTCASCGAADTDQICDLCQIEAVGLWEHRANGEERRAES